MVPALTAQAVFDQVVTGLAKQGGPSMSDNGTRCLYRAKNGRRCAAGMAILDTEYKTEFEGRNIEFINIPRLANVNRAREAGGPGLLWALQSAHDGAAKSHFGPDAEWVFPWHTTDGIAIRLITVADQFNLDPASVHASFPH